MHGESFNKFEELNDKVQQLMEGKEKNDQQLQEIQKTIQGLCSKKQKNK